MTRKKIIWDVNAHDIYIKVPQRSDDSECHIMVCALHCVQYHS